MAKSGKHSNKSLKLKPVIMLLAVTLLVCTAIGGTIAWLMDITDPKVNTFTVGDINITLTESDNLDLKMVPGKVLDKDPKVTVLAGSEACYVFVKVEESTTLDTYIDYVVLTGKTHTALAEGTYWNELDATKYPGVYYCKVKELADDGGNVELPVIGYKAGDTVTANKVLVKTGVTKTDMENLSKPNAVQPTLTFTAYAIQSEYLSDQSGNSINNAEGAWLLINPPSNP